MVAATPLEEARQQLTAHGLHPRLLPDNVKAYQLDAATGRFVVDLAEKVEFQVGAYPVRIQPRLEGVMKEGKLLELKGLQAKKFLWLNISAIEANASKDKLVFTVGPAKVPVPWSAFDP